MAKKQKKASLAEALRNNLKAAKEISRVCPGLFSSLVTANALESLLNYIFIFITARLLNELVSFGRAGVLIRWGVLGAAAVLIVEMTVWYFFRRYQLLEEVSREAIERLRRSGRTNARRALVSAPCPGYCPTWFTLSRRYSAVSALRSRCLRRR